jgi:hypothetical protein
MYISRMYRPTPSGRTSTKLGALGVLIDAFNCAVSCQSVKGSNCTGGRKLHVPTGKQSPQRCIALPFIHVMRLLCSVKNALC